MPILLYIKDKKNDKVHEITIDRKKSVKDLKKSIEQILNREIVNPLILKPKRRGYYHRRFREKEILDNENFSLEDYDISGGDSIIIK